MEAREGHENGDERMTIEYAQKLWSLYQVYTNSTLDTYEGAGTKSVKITKKGTTEDKKSKP